MEQRCFLRRCSTIDPTVLFNVFPIRGEEYRDPRGTLVCASIGVGAALVSLTTRSSCRHMTPLGIPVVPPVYSMFKSSPERPHSGTVRPWADAAASS